MSTKLLFRSLALRVDSGVSLSKVAKKQRFTPPSLVVKVVDGPTHSFYWGVAP